MHSLPLKNPTRRCTVKILLLHHAFQVYTSEFVLRQDVRPKGCTAWLYDMLCTQLGRFLVQQTWQRYWRQPWGAESQEHQRQDAQAGGQLGDKPGSLQAAWPGVRE